MFDADAGLGGEKSAEEQEKVIRELTPDGDVVELFKKLSGRIHCPPANRRTGQETREGFGQSTRVSPDTKLIGLFIT